MRFPSTQRLTSLLAGIALALVLSPAWAQEDAMKAYPGYVDFGGLTELFGEPAVQIAVGQSLLNMIGAFGAGADPDVADLFSRLHGVRVKVFHNPSLSDDIFEHVKGVSASLQGEGWEPVVSIDHRYEQVRVFMKLNGESVEGITLMALEDDEAVFVNVIGDLDPDELRHVIDKFNVDIDDEDDV